MGHLAGWITLIGGVAGAVYVYVGQRFSFAIPYEGVRSLVAAFVVGVLILGVCALLRARTAALQTANLSLFGALKLQADAQAAQALTEEQFRASFENAAVGKAQSDPTTGLILRVNRAFADMLGYRPEDLVGRSDWELTPEEDQEAERAEFQRMVDGRQDAYIREKRYLRRDGQAIWGRLSATVVRSPQTRAPVLVVAVIENIDGQYKAHAELMAAKESLETVLAERTATLSQRDLLLREVYHRVKNNLQIIDGLLLMERRGLKDPDARAALSALRDRVYVLGLVHHQLMGSHDLKTFEIAPFLEELSGNLLKAGAPSGVSLSVQATPLTVGLDFAIPLGLIVTELVTNSLKHAFPLGPGAIEVVLEQSSDGSVSLVVSDNGGAVEIATPIDGSQTSLGQTTLGMTIVDALVRQLGGVMTVRHDGGFVCHVQIANPVLL